METSAFVEAERQQNGLLARVEKHALQWLAQRTPNRITADHLTATGFAALFLAGLFYCLSRSNPLFLHLVNCCLFVNWLGDSLDGTVARHRHQQRPRYGFYVDHLVDAMGSLFLLSGLALSGYMSREVGFALLIVYYLLCINVYLATYTLGKFKISFASFSPTELRLLLGIGNIVLLYRPQTRLFGQTYLLYDVGGIIAIFLMLAVLITSTVRNTKLLYQAEKIR
jgi:archaetidylinositol phosphate synthase